MSLKRAKALIFPGESIRAGLGAPLFIERGVWHFSQGAFFSKGPFFFRAQHKERFAPKLWGLKNFGGESHNQTPFLGGVSPQKSVAPPFFFGGAIFLWSQKRRGLLNTRGGILFTGGRESLGATTLLETDVLYHQKGGGLMRSPSEGVLLTCETQG